MRPAILPDWVLEDRRRNSKVASFVIDLVVGGKEGLQVNRKRVVLFEAQPDNRERVSLLLLLSVGWRR
jgi:hypothetical protein